VKAKAKMQLQTINSKSITWQRVPIDCEEYTAAFCADGDGILQLVKYPDRYELLDQLDVIETWPRPTRLRHMLDQSDLYLACTYREIWECARHHEG
jgi:hypothetical protein